MQMISDNEMERRLKAIEKRVRAKPGVGTFRILEITGGLPGPINFAYAGSHRWERAGDEEFEDFVERSARAAFAAGEMILNVGGLPRGDEYTKYCKPDGDFDFERWWQEVAAPHYPEVPPEEPAGYRRPSRLGHMVR